MAACKRTERSFCLVHIDFDNFSAINNGYGHSVGDIVLKEMTKRIRKIFRTEDIFRARGR